MLGTRRLQKEAKALKKAWGKDLIRAAPNPKDLFEFHFVVDGPPDTPYEGGHYHGMLRFPAEYPMKPPAVFMFTPSGRFETNQRLCLSISDYHPESWNPVWSVSTIIQGLLSFMSSEDTTAGSVATDDDTRRHYASRSLAHNMKHKLFPELFPDLARLHRERKASTAGAAAAGSGGGGEPVEPSSAPAAVGHAVQAGPRTQAAQRTEPSSNAVKPSPSSAPRQDTCCGLPISGSTGFLLFAFLFVLFAFFLGEEEEEGEPSSVGGPNPPYGQQEVDL